MSLKENLIALVQGAFLPDEIENKITFLYLFESKIRNAGYSLTPNYPAPMPGSRSGFGRVDYLITCQEGEKCVVEIDGNAPRKRSIRKVCALETRGVKGFILLRSGRAIRFSASGVDVVSATNGK
ncbi:hypothetical protein ACVSUJ_22650 [Yersinia enterocolitica]